MKPLDEVSFTSRKEPVQTVRTSLEHAPAAIVQAARKEKAL